MFKASKILIVTLIGILNTIISQQDISGKRPQMILDTVSVVTIDSSCVKVGDMWLLGYDSPPKVLSGPIKIEIPDSLKNTTYDEYIVLEVGIEADGSVSQIAIRKGSNIKVFEYLAVEAVKQTQFQPAKQGDKPIPLSIAIPIHLKSKVLNGF
ncbi:MAG: TonB family protein [Planctomycetia bacterium]|nr:TonB family protein [Planctomycetia bacterium]